MKQYIKPTIEINELSEQPMMLNVSNTKADTGDVQYSNRHRGWNPDWD